MKILIANDTYYPHVNGASYFTQRLAAGLAARGHTVTVIAPSQTTQYTKEVRFGVTEYGMRSVKVPEFIHTNFQVCLPFHKKKIREILKECKPDIIHIQMHFSIGRNLLAVAKAEGYPVMLTNHFMPDNLTPYIPGPLFVKRAITEILWRDFARLANQVDYIASPTQTAVDLVQPRLKKKVHAVSNGIDLSHFSPGSARDEVYEKYRLPRDPFFLFVGRLDVEKNLDEVIKAYALAAPDITQALVLTGIGTQRESLEALARQLGVGDRVHFPGFVANEDLPDIYKMAMAFVMAGTAELQSIVTLEAMSTAMPVIAVNAGALPELAHDGENGFLYQHGDVARITACMKALAHDGALRTKMGEESLRIASRHSIENTFVEYERIYAAVIG
jgi:1,2-diacylglycerol 3-alpha-glucosyltransferase